MSASEQGRNLRRLILCWTVLVGKLASAVAIFQFCEYVLGPMWAGQILRTALVIVAVDQWFNALGLALLVGVVRDIRRHRPRPNRRWIVLTVLPLLLLLLHMGY